MMNHQNYRGLDDVLQQMQAFDLDPLANKEGWVFGKLTRCKTKGDSRAEKTGWYVLYEHQTEAGQTLYFGSFGDWRTGLSEKIKLTGVKLTGEEKEVMRARQERAKQDAAQRKEQDARRAARRAGKVWEKLYPAGVSAYLERKRIVGLGGRYSGKTGVFVVPMRTVKGLVGLQLIYPAAQENGRDKQYWPYGMQKDGAFCIIGPHPEPGQPILICEGYATGASLHMATNLTVVIAFDAGNLLPVGKGIRDQYPGRPLIFCADDDWQTKRPNGQPWNPGVEKATNAAVVLGGQVVQPVFSGERLEKWTDFNDLHLAENLDAVRQQVLAVVKPAADAGWRLLMHRSNSGGLLAHMINVSLILGNDERWAGVLGFNAFSGKTMKLRTPPYGGEPGEWSDLDDMLTTEWLAQQYGLLVKSGAVLEAVSVTAAKNAYHPVRNYLNGLTWDGQPRLDRWLTEILGVEDSDYTRKVSARWMIGAVARVMQPGAKVDNVLILEGSQGKGKSTALSILGGEWFMDTPFVLGDTEAFQQIRGKWIIELGELDAFNKADSTKAKQFFSASVDTFREKYGRRSADLPRQCVFAGTTNQEEYLKDTTGNRRYWPVRVETVHLDGLRQMKDQLWAEATARYRVGDIWWVEREEASLFEEQQEARYTTDAWEYRVRIWLDQLIGDTATADQILAGALNMDPGHWGKPEQMRVGYIMNRLGWRRHRLSPSGGSGHRPWGYKRPADWVRSVTAPAQPGPVHQPGYGYADRKDGGAF